MKKMTKQLHLKLIVTLTMMITARSLPYAPLGGTQTVIMKDGKI